MKESNFMKTKMKTPQIPTIVVVLGATGDLMGKKIVPSLFNLYRKNLLPEHFRLVGFARRDLTDRDLRDRAFEILAKRHKVKKSDLVVRNFLSLYSYQRGNFENKNDFESLAKTLQSIDESWGMCSNKLLYLAVPPRMYPEILNNVAATGLNKPCGGPDEGWTRVIVEKPFGSDERSAKALDGLLDKLFKEEQIYRIDHYLAKEMLQNILVFRFSNNLFESAWDKELIESIHVRLWESIGVEERGGFYDGVGALRDVGQNHLLQMLALVTMEKPASFSADGIRKERAKIIETLKTPSAGEVREGTFRAQYNGYRAIKGVATDSDTETYFKIKAALMHPRWQGVDITLESGKRMGKSLKEIEIVFRNNTPYKDSLTIHLEPKEGITVCFWSKKPGHRMELEKRELGFEFRRSGEHSQYTEEYEKLLFDCISDDQTLFVSSNEIKAMWRFTDPIIAGWKKGAVPLARYEPDASRIAQEAEIVDGAAVPIGMPKEIGVVGLGKMGAGLARQLNGKGWRVHVWNRTAEVTKNLEKEGLRGTSSIQELVSKLPSPKVVWLMVPAGKVVDEMIFGKEGVLQYLKKGDIIVDGGNSFFEDSIRRAEQLRKTGIRFVDVGVSGGPGGARNGASLMVGGDRKDFNYLEPLFYDLSLKDGYGYMGRHGAGHFVKMVHNGIEYGMMQALAEGFAVIRKSKLAPDLAEIAKVYGHGSVITSRLVDWLKTGYAEYGDDLKGVSGTVAHTGEGEWTVKTAKKLGVPVRVIEDSFKFRVQSEKNPSYIGQILSMLRSEFGGHPIKKGAKKR